MNDPRELHEIIHEQPVAQPHRRKGLWWLLVLPVLGWLACLGLIVAMFLPQLLSPQRVDIPVTGGDPAQPASPSAAPSQAAPQKPVSGAAYMNLAQQRLQNCTSSFHDYFVLEQMAVDQPDVFSDDTWRSNVSDAMQAFREDCQKLGSLPAAPSGYEEIDHWLKMAAGEVGPSADSLTNAINHDAMDQFQSSVDHLLRFVDYIHNAEGAIDNMNQRKEI